MVEYKQVIVVRTDLSMSKGKLAVQVAHASVSAYLKTLRRKEEWAEHWIQTGQKKIVVKTRDLSELLEIARKAENLGLPYAIIRDAGLTQLEPGTITALGIGPAPADMIDKITGELKLL
ncbi:MAG: peptidyl-tRNA hydrolase [Thermoplasmata archaeon]|nr:MAG: peptidyl-tRNA hydrolase [Thermoplasmata archaeon]